MKYEQLENGKKYRMIGVNSKLTYTFKNNRLFLNVNERIVSEPYDQVMSADYEEVLQYVAFDKAIEHMQQGYVALLYRDNYWLNNGMLMYYSDDTAVITRVELLAPKWILLKEKAVIRD